MRHTDTMLKISIVPRSKSALGHSQKLPIDQKLYSTQQVSHVYNVFRPRLNISPLLNTWI